MMMTLDLARARVKETAVLAARPQAQHLAEARHAGTQQRRRRAA